MNEAPTTFNTLDSTMACFLENIVYSLIAAVIFWVVIDYYPTKKKLNKAKTVLDLLIASIVEQFSYDRSGVSQHEKSVRFVSLNILRISEIGDLKQRIKTGKVNFLHLDAAIKTADSRLPDFHNALQLALMISPDRALDWLAVSDKVRLLGEEILVKPPNLDSQLLMHLERTVNALKEKKHLSPTELWLSSIQQRLDEFLDEVTVWQKGNGSCLYYTKRNKRCRSANRP
jgi:hypothetical protein